MDQCEKVFKAAYEKFMVKLRSRWEEFYVKLIKTKSSVLIKKVKTKEYDTFYEFERDYQEMQKDFEKTAPNSDLKISTFNSEGVKVVM